MLVGGGLYSHLNLMRASDYYALPGARDTRGEHRCVFCGGRGLWRKGEYRTSYTHCNCSRCKHYLYTE